MISSGLNFLLLAAVCWQANRLRESNNSSPTQPAAPANANLEAPEQRVVSRQELPQHSKLVPLSSGSTRPAFDWRQVESSDYKTYVANLRAAGCPEQTVRDIIAADLEATFADRRMLVMSNRYASFKFWQTGTTPVAVSKEQSRQQQLVDSEMNAALRELLGADTLPMDTTRAWHTAELDQQLSFLPADKQGAARDLLLQNEANDALIKTLSEAHRPTENADELNRILQTYEARRTDLARLLAPEDFAQLELTVSWTANNLRRGMANFNPTEEEFRAIFSAWRPHDENLAQLYATGQPDPGNNHVFAKIKELLGEERFNQYRATWWK